MGEGQSLNIRECSLLGDADVGKKGGAMLNFLKKELLDENAGLKKRVRELENIVGSIAAPMIVVDKNLMITSANDSALTAMGYRRDRRDEVVGKMTCADFQKTLLMRHRELYA